MKRQGNITLPEILIYSITEFRDTKADEMADKKSRSLNLKNDQ
jgi:hypothetical protein